MTEERTAFQRGRDVMAGLLALLLICDVLGWLDWIHPRKCVACDRPYHAGRPCDWTEDPSDRP